MKEYKLKINGTEYSVEVNDVKDGIAQVCVNGEAYEVEIGKQKQEEAKPEAPVVVNATPVKASAAQSTIKSPLPGIIVEVAVTMGQAVKAGQKVAVLEAMKMENEIQAECDGVVSAIHVKPGDTLPEGADIVSL